MHNFLALFSRVAILTCELSKATHFPL